MKYVLMVHSDLDHDRTLPPEETARIRAESMPRWLALFEHLGSLDPNLEGTELDDARLAKTVRVRDGETIVTDGPFAETKEQIGGVFVITLPDLDSAIDAASRIPTAEYGSIEIRPAVER